MQNKTSKHDVCSHSHSFVLDNFFRRLFQNPGKIVGDYIKEGDTVIDLGCGPGYFTLDMARMAGPSGKIHAVDLQPEMLEKAARKAEREKLQNRIIFHPCAQDKIGLSETIKADFILAYYMVHETPDHLKFLTEVKNHLKDNGKFLLVEPKFHVTKKHFARIKDICETIGYRILGSPLKKGGHSLLLSLKEE